MAYIVSALAWSNDVPIRYKKATHDILLKMAALKARGSYTTFLPLDYENPANQGFVGDVLWEIHQRCHSAHIPYLNILVGRADMEFMPHWDKGVGKFYQETFGGTLKGYDVWCNLQAQLAENALCSGAVEIT